jgi:hypothetical protein
MKTQLQNMNGEQPCLYWGKLKVNQPLSHDFSKYQEIIQENKNNGLPTHLFISDYHHYWVAKVESVHREIVSKERTIPFYDNKEVDIWFKISDMDLISGEFEETSYYLSQLFVDNKFHEESIPSLNPYIGGLSFPMIVEDKLKSNYFQNEFDSYSLRIKKNNPLISKNFICDQIQNQMKSFVLSPKVYLNLSHHTKNDLLSIEMRLAQSNLLDKEECRVLYSSYIQVLESVMNETLGFVLKNEFGRSVYIDETGMNISEKNQEGYLPVNEFVGAIKISAFVELAQNVSKYNGISLELIDEKYSSLRSYFDSELAPFMLALELAEKQKRLLAHSELEIKKSDIFELRNSVLGVGCTGIINNLITLFLESDQAHYLKNAS